MAHLRKQFRLPLPLAAAALAVAALASASAAPPAPLSPAPTPQASRPAGGAPFASEIRPLLEAKCLGCHGVGLRLSGLDLRSASAALKGGTRGPALVRGSAEKSLLYHLVAGTRTPQMPPAAKLAPSEIALIKRWIDAGAPWPDGQIEKASEQVWWSFRPPEWPRVPWQQKVSPGAPRRENPIDAFLLAELKKNRLKPSAPASRRVLIRRAYLDLIGLPPPPEAVSAFERDPSPGAWEKVVDGLLKSPHYGERWGRHWLDLVRYADSGGFEGDKDRPDAWRYRDYVINAFNEDRPYDRFIREQIAGDEIRPGDPEAIIATGYLACGPQDQVQKDARTRADDLDDLVSTTGSVFLGLTVGCARCHDHKYDPVKQTDYYRLQAIFAPSERKDIDIPTPEERAAHVASMAVFEQEIKPFRERADALRKRGTDAAKAAGHEKPADPQIQAALSESDRRELADVQKSIKEIEARRPELPKAMAVTDKGREAVPVHLLIRGDAFHPGPVVQPGFIVSLPGGTQDVAPAPAAWTTTGRRNALAEWLASPQNPLTARVWMNRVWQHHFGRGIVGSPSNFGLNGELPTHAALLDWLALKFQAGGWRLKPMHRMMLLSNTYRQASLVRQPEAKRDPQNRFYWRMPLRRLEAEVVRDSILSVAGSLNRTLGGPPVYPPVDPTLRADTFLGMNWPEGEDSPRTWRRSVYVKVKRSLLLPQLEAFDCPEITGSVAQRNVTTTPMQALTLLNDPLILRQADMFARRIRREAGESAPRQVERAYWLAAGRAPTPRETAIGGNYLRRRGLESFCHAMLNLNEFVYSP